ncbi:E3 ubiquitin-protein ligase SMURF2-like isoform X2 [Clavelina lepadiformis]|uniref:E3 ubiquitin-protein ligase SMURF2-like isoform X2 n=1 Tax=Clavelina lepadiformis TaxID=159417 RepID=UPI0040411DA5
MGVNMFKVKKIRVTVFCAKNICKRDFFRLPDPFAKILVDGSGQCHVTGTCKATLDPKWNQHYDLYVGKSDSITISVWNHRKVHKRQGAGFLGCIRIMSNAINRLKDTGYQRLDLCKSAKNDQEPVRGQIVVSIESRDLDDRTPSNAVIDARSLIPPPNENDLPEGWEARVTNGRVQYVNHYTRTTQWERPKEASRRKGRRPVSAIIDAEPSHHRARTGSSSAEQIAPPGPDPATSEVSRARRHRNYLTRNELHGPPAPLPEGYEQRTTQQGQVYFLHTQTGVSSWHDPRIPRNLTHINPDDLGPLPSGWELRSTATGRLYYVDHSSRTTQFTDPRIGRYIGQLQSRERRSPSAAPDAIEPDSQLPRYKRDLVHKLKILRTELQSHQPQTGHCRLEVKRPETFEQSYSLIMKMKPKDLRKRLMVKFSGEDGLDYGGLAREWLYILSHEMLNPYYGLFQYSREDIYTLQINPDSHINPDHLSYFHFVGRVLGMAVFHGHYIDGGFTMLFYKQLLGKQISIEDMVEVDPDLYNSMKWILQNDISGVLDHTFCVESNSFGERLSHELKPNGSNIAVTESNKREYVKLYVNWRFLRGIEAQFLSLSKGFYELVPQHLLRQFDERELELIIGGLGKINVDDWKKHTKLKHCSHDSNVVRWFWRAIDGFEEEKRARVLQFVTGSSRVPLQGFKALQGSTGTQGPRLFTIQLVDIKTESLPKAHTCFNRIDLPPYESYEKLQDKLTCAVENTCGFFTE